MIPPKKYVMMVPMVMAMVMLLVTNMCIMMIVEWWSGDDPGLAAPTASRAIRFWLKNNMALAIGTGAEGFRSNQ